MTCRNFADLRSDERNKEVLQTRQQEEQGVHPGQDHDGAGLGLPRPQHSTSHSGTYRGRGFLSFELDKYKNNLLLSEKVLLKIVKN